MLAYQFVLFFVRRTGKLVLMLFAPQIRIVLSYPPPPPFGLLNTKLLLKYRSNLSTKSCSFKKRYEILNEQNCDVWVKSPFHHQSYWNNLMKSTTNWEILSTSELSSGVHIVRSLTENIVMCLCFQL